MPPQPCGVRSAFLLLSWLIGAAAFAAYPEKPIRFVIPGENGTTGVVRRSGAKVD